jgi:hypothetical protein
MTYSVEKFPFTVQTNLAQATHVWDLSISLPEWDHNLTVELAKFKGKYNKTTWSYEFDSEHDYLMFIMRWS